MYNIIIVPNIIGTLFAVVSKSQTLCIVFYKRFAKTYYLTSLIEHNLE